MIRGCSGNCTLIGSMPRSRSRSTCWRRTARETAVWASGRNRIRTDCKSLCRLREEIFLRNPGANGGGCAAFSNSAAGFGSPLHDGRGRFWNVPLTTFIGLSILGQDLIAPPGPNRGLNSNLVKALKGEVPFDGFDFPRMPLNRQPVAPEHIAFIQDWIDRGCPEE